MKKSRITCIASLLLIGHFWNPPAQAQGLQNLHRITASVFNSHVEYHQINIPKGKEVTLAQVKDAIIQAALDKGWHADEAGPGEVRVTLKWKDHSAVSSVFYTQKTYSIKLDSSVNLKEENGNIHKKYNEEVRALQSEIDRRLYLHAH